MVRHHGYLALSDVLLRCSAKLRLDAESCALLFSARPAAIRAGLSFAGL